MALTTASSHNCSCAREKSRFTLGYVQAFITRTCDTAQVIRLRIWLETDSNTTKKLGRLSHVATSRHNIAAELERFADRRLECRRRIRARSLGSWCPVQLAASSWPRWMYSVDGYAVMLVCRALLSLSHTQHSVSSLPAISISFRAE